MNIVTTPSKQPLQVAWTRKRLVHERAVALGQSIDISTRKNYSSALNSYLNFVRLHNFSVNPTPNTVFFFVVYMSYHIKASSVDSYLLGICQQLEPFLPDVRQILRLPLVKRTLDGCKRLRNKPTNRKRALTHDDLLKIVTHYSANPSHNNKLFVAQLLTGFYGLLRLGEMVDPDDNALINPRKTTRCLSYNVGGHFMRAGGATALAEDGARPDIIQAAGRWSSDPFKIYVQKNTILIHSLMHNRMELHAD
ncbi:hypothetical protein B0H34DRAFT_782498 [Crassisporium funariophilum]|nr:hypothetical protein B0H34DRAFT_782498 [Crassisporium funariophilum]